MERKLLLRPEEVAESLGLSRSRVYELLATNIIPSIAVGRSRRIPAEALQAWVAQQVKEQAADGATANLMTTIA